MPSTPTDLVVWHLTDSALPTGGFAHSAGLETYVQSGAVADPESYGRWLDGYLRQASCNEALAVRLAVELHAERRGVGKLRELDQLAHACQAPAEVRKSLNSMGRRWAKIAAIVAPGDELVASYAAGLQARQFHGNPGIAAGLVFSAVGLDARAAVAAYLMQMANSMTQNAIRAIPLGQDAGQQVLVAAYPTVQEATDMTMAHGVEDLGAVAPGLEIAQMAHESLHSRMFMS